MAELQTFIDDLRAEGESLDALVADLPEEKWATMTPAEGWSVAHQIGHLHWTDSAAILAITDPDGFAEQLKAAFVNPAGFVDDGAAEQAARPPAELLADWRAGRTALVEALTAAPSGTKFPWYGPPMGGVSMATARLMETWAHGQDVADALGVERAPTARIKNIAHLGVRTRNFAYSVNEKTPPADDFRVELTAPDGSLWTWGPEDAPQKVTGPRIGLLFAGHSACQSRRSRSGCRWCRRGRVARVRAGICRTQRRGTSRTRSEGG
ncbi:wyosine base formation domain-containing protein [Rhodococcus erythropolis]|uniref:Wyosine base formation domain-containing protein n=1 Tax=Rhodococcus erythropolis TaxID=1833 RepID=A0A6G9CQ30_RHOER|nr:wyosine base formation domain-containing protein [Rhodococcus erythropolis]